jgi:hypothetical protein|tara:strand:- start:2901 stop:3119 length:219 start_codon:yes stop_codon:yes gene_type:complete
MDGNDQWVRQWGVLYGCVAETLPHDIAKKKEELAALDAQIAATSAQQYAAGQLVVARQSADVGKYDATDTDI